MTLDCVGGLGSVDCTSGIDVDANTLYGVVPADWKENCYTSIAETQLAIIDAMTPTNRGDQARHRKWFHCWLQKAFERAEDPEAPSEISNVVRNWGGQRLGPSLPRSQDQGLGTRRPIRSFTVHPANIPTGRTLIRTRS